MNAPDKHAALAHYEGQAAHDGKFGCSVDGFIDHDGVWECKTMVSTSVMFATMVDGDIARHVPAPNRGSVCDGCSGSGAGRYERTWCNTCGGTGSL